MSEDPRRICVCGRQRNKEPVIITITTCKNNHGITTTAEGATVCVTSVSPQPPPSSDQPAVEKPPDEPIINKPPPSTESTQPSASEVQDSDAITEDEPADTNQIETLEETNPGEEEEEAANDADTPAEDQEDPTEEKPFVVDSMNDSAENQEEEDENMEEQNAEVQLEDEAGLEPETATEGVEPSGEDNDGIDDPEGVEPLGDDNDGIDDPEEEVKESESAEGDETTVMMLTETAVNTVPFLNRLFWSPNDATFTKPTANDQDMKECTTEVIVLERHTGDCRHDLARLSAEKCIFDGESIITNCGRFDISDKNIFSDADIKKLVKTKVSRNQNHPARNKSILEIVKGYFRNKPIYDNLSDKTASPFSQLQKYLSPPSDDECVAVLPIKIDQSLQVGSTYISSKSRWYDGFLMCIGLKAGESLYDIKDQKDNLELKKESSSLMTKYLRI